MKIKNYLFVGMALLCLGACQHSIKPTHAPHVYHDTLSFSAVAAEVDRLNALYSPQQVLLVLDIDNTVLTSEVDLGGDVWYQWQREKLPVKPTDEQKVECLFEDAIGLLYELSPMRIVESGLPELIKGWQSSGNTVFALTSRSPKYRAATERELHRNGVDFAVAALKPVNKEVPVYAGTLDRPFSYIRGIMMTTGMDKGEMLKYILKRSHRDFKAVVFVDDSKKNIDNMFNAYQQSHFEMSIFSYNKIEQERVQSNGAVLTQEQANKMATQWSLLDGLLNQIFPARELDGTCLGF
jgi:hypothetical protein